MMSFIRKRVLNGAGDNPASPVVLVSMSTYIFLNLIYTAVLFPRWELAVRAVLGVLMIAVFVVLERSSLKKPLKAFLVPTVLTYLVIAGCIILDGDSLIYTLLLSGIIISITYLNEESLKWHIIAVIAVIALLESVFRFNLMGPDFSFILNITFLASYVLLGIILYTFSASYIGALQKMESVLKQREEDIKTISELAAESKASDRAKSAFLATMSHEIRTPMNAIIGITQIQMQKEELPAEYAAAFEKINSAGNNLLGIINDILDMSKIETGKLELTSAQYDVPGLISEAVQLNAFRIGAKPLEFILEIDENLPSKLYGDALRIKQILNNLLSNAVKYTEKGFVKLAVNHCAEGEDVRLKFIVTDTGQGIKPEDRERLFAEIYLRFNAEANRETEGTGIGLNITKNLVELMDGTVTVESEYGKGSVFTATVKQKAVECAPIGAKIAANLRGFSYVDNKIKERREIIHSPMPYGSVLIVDDVESNLFVAEGLLAQYKLKIATADSGFKAIEKIENGENYDIIFMDHMMPKLDGIETTKAIRARGYQGVIIALTANALVGNDEMFRQNGFDGFIAKPIDIRQLNSALNKYVRDAHPAESVDYQAHKYRTETAAQAGKAPVSPKLKQIFCREAEKAVATLRETIADKDLKMFTTTAHAMKSALLNIGEVKASESAFALEKAGLDGDLKFIAANAESFIETLGALSKKLRPEEAETTSASENPADSAEDTAFFKEQLTAVKIACENYADTAAFAALDLLKEKAGKKETAAALEEIYDLLFLNSDFEEAAKRAEALCREITRSA